MYIETVKVKPWGKGQGEFVIVNKDRYEANKDKYELYEPVKKSPGRPKKGKDD